MAKKKKIIKEQTSEPVTNCDQSLEPVANCDQLVKVDANGEINHIIVHCTASKPNVDLHVKNVNDMHLGNGWRGIGYHYLIALDGTIEVGRDIAVAGAHCNAPNINATSIGVAYVGGLDEEGNPCDTRTPAQKVALRHLLTLLKSIWPKAEISGHRDWSNKACPCFDALKEYKDIEALPVNLN